MKREKCESNFNTIKKKIYIDFGTSFNISDLNAKKIQNRIPIFLKIRSSFRVRHSIFFLVFANSFNTIGTF
jgi:hypothetical protein